MRTNVLRKLFRDQARKYSEDDRLIETLWVEIEKNYGGKGRFYHTLAHLHDVYTELLKVKNELADWDVALFSLYYHDIVYDPASDENESRSAEAAAERLRLLTVPGHKIYKCVFQILATREHLKSGDHDTNLFTDADLSVLGQTWDTYAAYSQNVRKEYAIFPDSIYNPGRKKVLQHFLDMDRIFKTRSFYEKYEQVARQNLAKELQALLNGAMSGD